MFWLFTDETNLEPTQGDFFIYGGLVMNGEQIGAVHRTVVEVRRKYKFQDGDQFKFQTKGRPKHITVDNWNKAKAEVITKAECIGVQLLIYVVLHKIAANNTRNTNIEWALNSVLAHFDLRFLAAHQDIGAVCLDRLPDKVGYSYLQKKFENGVDLPDGRRKRLSRIVHYSMSCNRASHISSLVDIVLGGMRYSVNAASGTQGKEETARKLLPPLGRMMWHRKEPDGTRQVGGYGFIKSPKKISKKAYADQYKTLATSLSDWASTTD